MTEIIWPERPTCHDGDWMAERFGGTNWREANRPLHPENHGTPPAYRSCSYCGSMHPQDLIVALQAGAKLGGADWKYGWPHKFYVDNIPNPNAGKRVSKMSGSMGRATDEQRAAINAQYAKPGFEVVWEETQTGVRYRVYEPDGPTTHGKWYNEHLKDLSDEAFAVVAELLHKHAHILFVRRDGKIGYSAPSTGYQAS